MNSSVIYKFEEEIDKTNEMTDMPNKGSDQIFSDQCSQLQVNGPIFLHVEDEDHDQMRQMSRLI